MTKINVFKKKSSLLVSFSDPPVETLIFNFQANSRLTCQTWTFFHVSAHCARLLKVLLAFYIACIYCACVFLIASVGVHKDKCLHHKTTHTQHHHDGLLWPSLAATDLFFCFRPNCYKRKNNNNISSKLERGLFGKKWAAFQAGFIFG